MDCRLYPLIWRAMLPVLVLLLSACATPQVAPQPPAPPQVPPLPASARQPQLPELCSPTCSAGLTRLRDDWRRRLTEATPPAGAASAPMTR